MTLIKTSILSGIATIIKVITGFFLNKIIAIYVGPIGLAYIGQFQNFSQFVMSFASGAINQGIVKYTAEYKNDITEKRKLWSCAIYISTISTFIVSITLIILNKFLSFYFFKTDEYNTIFIVFAVTLFFFVLNSLFISILNGQGEIIKLTIINVTSSFVTLLLTGFLSYYYKIYGALLSLTLCQSVVFIITLMFVIRSHWFRVQFFLSKFSIEHLKKLFKYALMAITSALTVPVSQVLIRNYIGQNLSWESAGYWEGITRISSIYLMMVTTTLSIYYLPKLSSLDNNKEIRTEIFNGYKIIMPIIIIGAISIYVLRNYAITILFTNEFQPMAELFLFQLLGDILKIASWLIGYLMIAKAMTVIFIINEIIFNLLYVGLSFLLIKYIGLVGTTYAYFINYILCLFFMIFIFRNLLIDKTEE